MTHRFKVTIEYDGTNYIGYQVQKNGPSIQGELNRALKRMTHGIEVGVCGSSRTDSGVHARGQVVHFDYPADIQPRSVQKALNSLLPDDIYVKKVELVSDQFHARYHVVGKRYIYRVDLNESPNPFKRLYTLHHPYRCDVERMKEALKAIEGTHDFTTFCSIKTEKDSKVRTIYRADVSVSEDNELEFIFEGNGFLYNMIRILVGTTLQIGDGLKPIDELSRILPLMDRRLAGPTAPPHGLYLDAIFYDEQE